MPSKKGKTKYIEIKHLKNLTKTALYDVKQERYPYESLGQIKWHGSWRQYCFFPTEEFATVFSSGCLEIIEKFLKAVNHKHRNGNVSYHQVKVGDIIERYDIESGQALAYYLILSSTDKDHSRSIKAYSYDKDSGDYNVKHLPGAVFTNCQMRIAKKVPAKIKKEMQIRAISDAL